MSNQPSAGTSGTDTKTGFFGRIILFVKQVIAELKKTVWPTGEQWWTFFLVVLVFVLCVMAYTGLLDLLFGWLNKLIFA
ncbi:preprotein translocase subunit SecE [Gleimia hominis]|uniref:preprotein translocase subunit SecE n=1 Tax=Gleimia hominis TaxID=595468 RepID=UPI000C802E0B|nr:preprotein translocase subunit SecE [Gleimia hominis]WIK64564.1 preprotein translocase subunit SecE [Gleimia hominis]